MELVPVPLVPTCPTKRVYKAVKFCLDPRCKGEAAGGASHFRYCEYNAKNLNFENRKNRRRIIRFKSIQIDFLRFFANFGDFWPKIKLDTGKRLEMIRNMYPFLMTSCVNGFPFRYSGELKTNTVELYRMTH